MKLAIPFGGQAGQMINQIGHNGPVAGAINQGRVIKGVDDNLVVIWDKARVSPIPTCRHHHGQMVGQVSRMQAGLKETLKWLFYQTLGQPFKAV